MNGEPRVAQSPEQALLMRVLEQALYDLQALSRSPRAMHRDEAREIKAWIDSDDRSATMGGFSFVFICEHLGLCPESVRERVPALPSTGRVAHRVVGTTRAIGGR